MVNVPKSYRKGYKYLLWDTLKHLLVVESVPKLLVERVVWKQVVRCPTDFTQKK